MSPIRAWALLLVVAATPSRALELRRLGEVRAGSGASVEWLDAHRHARLKNEWERGAGGLRRVTFVVADVRDQELRRLAFDLAELPTAHRALFTGAPNVELVHFDGTSGLLRFDRREPSRTVSYYSVWTPATGALGAPTELGEVAFTSSGGERRASRVVHLLGPDPAASRLYFADVTRDGRPAPEGGPLAIRLFRVTFPALEVDWEMDLVLPRRARQLEADRYRAFSPDGRKLALAEYSERAAQGKPAAVPPPQVYVVDLERKEVARYPIPPTPYGLAFSRDGRYLAVGSHEEAAIVRIDLEAGRVERRVRAQAHIQGFGTTASGEALLVMSDHIGAPRSIEVRRWSDLSLRETIPVSRLFPGVAGIHPSGVRVTPDGRYLVAPRYAADGYPDRADAGLVTFAIEEGASAARPDPTALLTRHVERSGLRLYSYHLKHVGNADGYFAPIVANDAGEAFAIGTRSDVPEDAPYQEGKSHPYAMWVDRAGKVVWERSLRRGKTFLDYQGGSAVATPDGAFLAFFMGYVTSSSGATPRLVKLDRAGKVLWEWTSPIGREARFPEELRLLPSGRVLMRGHLGTSRTPWVGELDASTGRLVRDEPGGPP